MLDPLLSSVRGQLLAVPLIAGARVIVAVSGGQDSVALLDILVRLKDDLPISLEVAHVDHSLRPESAEEAVRVRELTQRYQLPLHLRKVDPAGRAKRLKLGIEEASRELRLAALMEIAACPMTNAPTYIALGHTQDDHVETILLHVLRGCGTGGLRGLEPISEPFIRPLLHLTREQTTAYCHQRGLPVIADPTNLSREFTRNRVRLDLLPMLEREFNPAVKKALSRLAETSRWDVEALESLAQSALQSASQEINESRVVLKVDALRVLPRAVAARVLLGAISHVRGSTEDISFDLINKLLNTVQGGRAFSQELPGAPLTKVSADPSVIVVAKEGWPISAVQVEYTLALPGTTSCPRLGYQVQTRLGATNFIDSSKEGADHFWILPSEKLVPPLILRNRKPGDRIELKGGGTKKLQDLLVDRKVPANHRDRIPILADQNGIVAVGGYGVYPRICLGDEPGERVVVTLEPLSEAIKNPS